MPVLAASTLKPAAEWPVVIVATSAGLAVLLLIALVAAVIAEATFSRLTYEVPSPKWSFDSWALHLTAVGGVLGTALGLGALPETPAQIDKESVVALSLLFGGLVVAAPFICEAVRRPRAPGGGGEAAAGYVGVMLFTCAIVFCGAFGELFTLGLVTWELTGGDAGGVAIEVGLGLLSLLAFYYVGVSAWEAALIEWQPAAAPLAQLHGFAELHEHDLPAEPQQAPTPLRASWSLP